jgi:hypothetical protein
MTYADALEVLAFFTERDYAQGRPHLYVRSRTSNKWIRPKGLRIFASSEAIEVLDWESEQWEIIPFKEFDFGLW